MIAKSYSMHMHKSNEDIWVYSWNGSVAWIIVATIQFFGESSSNNLTISENSKPTLLPDNCSLLTYAFYVFNNSSSSVLKVGRVIKDYLLGLCLGDDSNSGYTGGKALVYCEEFI